MLVQSSLWAKAQKEYGTMSGMVMGCGYVKLYTGVQMPKKTADVITAWILHLYIEFPNVYRVLMIANGRNEAVTDPLALDILQAPDVPVRLLSNVNNKLAIPAAVVMRAMLALSISGEPQDPYPNYIRPTAQ